MTKIFCDDCTIELDETNKFHGYSEWFPLSEKAMKEKDEKIEVQISTRIKAQVHSRDAHLCKLCIVSMLKKIVEKLNSK